MGCAVPMLFNSRGSIAWDYIVAALLALALLVVALVYFGVLKGGIDALFDTIASFFSGG